jgi:hypothetical protein
MKKEIKKEKYTLEFFKSNKCYIFWFCIFCLLFTICFYLGQLLNPVAFNEYFGTFGEFVGGVLGTLFALISIVLMKNTFDSQRQESKDQRNDAAIQRFNNLFFELLRVYQENVKELGGKQFFNEQQQKIQKEEYEEIKQYNNYKYRVLNWYIPFYVKNRSKLAPYFRTLYRMFEVLENNEKLLGDKSKEYAKIIRAQLSESELFFIRANVHSMYGEDFVDYINKYRIFKHLPFCDLPEYPEVWGWDLELKEGINLTYLTIYEATKNKFEGSDELPKLFEASKRYKFTFNLNKEKTEFKIKLEINKNIERDYGEFKWIEECRSNEDIKNMLDNFLREIFDFSNFHKFNEFIILPIKIDEETGTIISSIKSIKGEPEPLRIKYDHTQKDD